MPHRATALPTAAAPDQVSVSHCLLGARGEILAADGEDLPYYAASTIKLHVLLAALQAADRGALDLEEPVAATRTSTGSDGAPFTLGGDHLDPSHPADGTAVPLRDLLVRMIDRSSNEATNQLGELLGLDAVAAAIARLDLSVTRVERLIGDASALAAGATNETGALDLARTLLALVQPGSGPRLSAASVDLARAALRAQQIPVIATALRKGVDHGSKSGWVDGYRHDVAFLGDPDGPDLRVLAVMTSGLSQQEADDRIRQLVRELVPDAAA